MYIVRWFVGHPIMSIWALAIIALLLNMSGESKKHGAGDVSTEQAQTTATKTAGHEHVAGEKADTTTQTESATTQTGATKQANVVSHEAQTKVAAISAQSATSDLLSPSASDATVKGAQQALSMQGLNSQSTDDLLLMAREAYWNNGLDEATAIYKQLIQSEPTVVEYKGELGNVYWKQGFPKKATALYAEIALSMIKNGHAERVENMISSIELFHPEKAAEIKKTLQGLK
ncbi:MAG TPA: hypothetical protein ENJ51_12020 [Leucothrix mucor]|uniref:Tetratricopeptide repeat protein n=1 Tax=Leucothrix mucor TaxID=45248 RepID=A0A7V2T1P1_LEUMU|nr:hypothetical protein [Leucothrix mucor]